MPRSARLAIVAAVFAGASAALILRPSAPADLSQASFAARIEALSEPGGYFDTDNLISNERSYLHVVSRLREGDRRGGAYVGVGPDQNFSYIAHARPSIAIIVDIRRDNLLLHLLFKALFQLASTRMEYLSLLTGRSPPLPAAAAADVSIDRLVEEIDGAPRQAPRDVAAIEARMAAAIRGFGVPLSADDYRTIAGFHSRFIADGLSLQFNSFGRAPRWDYPSFRDLLLETDLDGAPRSFLAAESDYQFVRQLQAQDFVIPIVGDVAGPHAMGAIGAFLAERQQGVSALYLSNVEFYLFRAGTFGRFVANLGRLPHRDSSLIIRSVFTGDAATVPGYNSASLTQSTQALVDGYGRGEFRRYYQLVAASR